MKWMRMSDSLVTLLFLSFFLSGCSSVVDSSKVGQIVPGKTSATEVTTILGEPVQKNGIRDAEIWSYWYRASGSGPRQGLEVFFDKDLVVSRLAIVDAVSKTMQFRSDPRLSSVPLYPTDKAELLCDGVIEVASIDGFEGQASITKDIHGRPLHLVDFGDVARGEVVARRQMIYMSPGTHDIGFVARYPYAFVVDGRRIDEPVHQSLDLKPNKEYHADFRFVHGSTGAGRIILNGLPMGHGWTVISSH
jgi:outer membrane protein assembly factor BamE (lipoprotein component of BamABCDE complex)